MNATISLLRTGATTAVLGLALATVFALTPSAVPVSAGPCAPNTVNQNNTVRVNGGPTTVVSAPPQGTVTVTGCGNTVNANNVSVVNYVGAGAPTPTPVSAPAKRTDAGNVINSNNVTVVNIIGATPTPVAVPAPVEAPAGDEEPTGE